MWQVIFVDNDRRELARCSEGMERLRAAYLALMAACEPEAPAGCEINRLEETLRDAPVPLGVSLVTAVNAAVALLGEMHSTIEGDYTTRAPLSLMILNRTAMLAAARVVYVLGPADPQVREDHATQVACQEAASLDQSLRAAETFHHYEDFKPPHDFLEQVRPQIDAMRRKRSPRLSEHAMLQEAASVLAEHLHRSGHPPMAGEVAAEQLRWGFNVHSGAAHSYAWPKLMPGNGDFPGRFIQDLGFTQVLAGLAVQAMRMHSKAPDHDRCPECRARPC